jgi:hypothetical protein
MSVVSMFLQCRFTPGNAQVKMILILDGHSGHTLSLAAIEMPCEQGVVTLSLPTHNAIRMQPLDVKVFPNTDYIEDISDRNEAERETRSATVDTI